MNRPATGRPFHPEAVRLADVARHIRDRNGHPEGRAPRPWVAGAASLIRLPGIHFAVNRVAACRTGGYSEYCGIFSVSPSFIADRCA